MHLEIKNLHTYYGLVHMLKGVSLNVNEGEIISIDFPVTLKKFDGVWS